MAVGYIVSILLMGSTWGLMVSVCVINGGVGLAYGAMPALLMGTVPRSDGLGPVRTSGRAGGAGHAPTCAGRRPGARRAGQGGAAVPWLPWLSAPGIPGQAPARGSGGRPVLRGPSDCAGRPVFEVRRPPLPVPGGL